MIYSKQIKENIYMIRATEHSDVDFHGPVFKNYEGSSYNSYLIIDEEITLIDTMDEHLAEEFVGELLTILEGRKVDNIIINHVEPDHSGSYGIVRKMFPQSKSYCSAKAEKALKHLFFEDFEYNIVELVKLLKNLSKANSASSMKDRSKKIELMARNSSLYFRQENKVLADKLEASIVDGKMSLWLEHGSGNAVFVAEDGKFSLEGENLDDAFMEALLAGSKFSGGTLSFTGSGNTEKFNARFKVQDTLLEDYGVMNNVLAFLDTIPALITFSVPDYNTEGMFVDSALLDLTYADTVYTVNSFDVNSSVLTIRGVGKASISEDTIDLTLNLLTQWRKNLSKIPLIGYVLVGDEKVPSIKLDVTGKLSDPDIQNSAFEEIVTLPFDIGFRVLSLPFQWMDDLFSDEDPNAQGNSKNK